MISSPVQRVNDSTVHAQNATVTNQTKISAQSVNVTNPTTVYGQNAKVMKDILKGSLSKYHRPRFLPKESL